jgi:hypothetical protein
MKMQRHLNHKFMTGPRLLMFLLAALFLVFVFDRYVLSVFRRQSRWLATGESDCTSESKEHNFCDTGGFYRKSFDEPSKHLFSQWRKQNQTLSVSKNVSISDLNFAVHGITSACDALRLILTCT